jgi:hypothetical protein
MSKSLSAALGISIAAVVVGAAQAQSTPAEKIIAQENAKGLVVRAPEPTPVERILAQERGRAADLGLTKRPPVLIVNQAAGGFDWADAGVGGAAGLALALLAGAGVALRNEGRRKRATA